MRKMQYILFILLFCLYGCGNNDTANVNTDQEKAEQLYQEAQKAFAAGNVDVSKILIDSINNAYHLNVSVRKKAAYLMNDIRRFEKERTSAYNDSLRPLLEKKVEVLLPEFVETSNPEYYKYKKYTHRTQNHTSPHTSIIAEVKDNGELSLISVYLNKKELNHIKVRVSNSENFFVTTASVPLTSAYNSRFDDLGIHWEYVTFTSRTLNGLAEFIANNVNDQLIVTLFSDSQTYSYVMDPSDRLGIKKAVELSSLLIDIKRMH